MFNQLNEQKTKAAREAGVPCAPDIPPSLLRRIAEDYASNTAGVQAAISNVRDLLMSMRGPMPESDGPSTEGLNTAEPSSDIAEISDAQSQLHTAVKMLHSVTDDLRATLGY